MSGTETVASQDSSPKRGAIWMYSLIAAAAAPAALWAVIDPLVGHRLVAMSGSTAMQVTAPWVVAGGLIPGACGLAVAGLLRRFAHGRTVWLVVSSVVLLLSLASPFGGTTTMTVAVLLVMHLLVGAAVIPGGYALAKR